MKITEFRQTLTLQSPPDEISPLAKALWYDAKGDWEAAHDIAQSKEGTKEYDLLHGYLHRVEGDKWNAGYWYRRAGMDFPDISLEEEWEQLANRWL
jgi:hypothetical protein